MLLDLKIYRKKNIFKFIVDLCSLIPKTIIPERKQIQHFHPSMVFPNLIKNHYCDSCLLCMEECPTHALFIKGIKGEKPREFFLDTESCINCNLCIEICPQKALTNHSFKNDDFFKNKIFDLNIKKES